MVSLHFSLFIIFNTFAYLYHRINAYTQGDGNIHLLIEMCIYYFLFASFKYFNEMIREATVGCLFLFF